MQKLLTVDQVADRLNCHRETVLRHIRTGHLKAARIGKGYVVSEPAFAAFLHAQSGADQDDAQHGETADG